MSMTRMRSTLLCGALVLLTSLSPVRAQFKKPAAPPPNRPAQPEAVLAAERALRDFNCGIHYANPQFALRKGKRVVVEPGGAVDQVAFPATTKDADLARLTPQLVRLTKLRAVDLGNNSHITEKGLKNLARLTNLEALFLDHTAANRACLKELASIKTLKWLDLSGTPIADDDIKQAEGISSLESLVINQMPRLTDVGIANVVAIKQLRYLEVTIENDPSGKKLQAIAAGGKIQHLKIAPIGDAQAALLGTMNGLDTLDLSNPGRETKFVKVVKPNEAASASLNRITDAGLNALGGMKNLRVLNLAHVDTIEGKNLGDFTKLSTLEELTLKATPFGNDGLAKLGAMPMLRTLDLRATLVTDAGLAELVDMPDLQHLLLAELRITDNGLQHLTRLPSLAVLDLSGSRVTAAVKDLRNLTQLEQLHLASTLVSASALPTLSQLKSLRILNLTDNCPAISSASVKKLEEELPNCAVLATHCATDFGGGIGIASWPGAMFYQFKTDTKVTSQTPTVIPKTSVQDKPPPPLPAPPTSPPPIRNTTGGGTGPKP
jgi:Leucine-rich repeat (LRR) protein